MNLELSISGRYNIAGRKKPMTRDEVFAKLIEEFPTCEIKSISEDHKYVTYCKVTRVCKICGKEWATKVSNALHLGSGCGQCAKTAQIRAHQEANIDPAIVATVYKLRSVCGKFYKIGFTQNLKKRVARVKRETPFAVCDDVEILFSGNPHEAFVYEKTLLDAGVSANFSGFCGATEWCLRKNYLTCSID